MQTSRSSCPDPPVDTVRLDRTDGRYPTALKDLQENAPTHLWIRGRLETLDRRPMVAIVGTRRASSHGLRAARELAGALARAGACVVSGMALGIDSAAHEAALECDGSTLAVLGTGLDVVYPPAHRRLQRSIMLHGALVTELEPDWHGTKWTFPLRNRIIAALATVTIVVEAPSRSGALITAGQALDLGRTIGVVPGPIDRPVCAGSNKLLREGAHVITDAEDALTLVGLPTVPRTPRVAPEGDAGRVWSALATGEMDIDTLCSRSGLPAARCLAAVTSLELAGAIECVLTGAIRRR